MNGRRIVCAVIGLAVGLVFYLAHRSEHTLSNRLLGGLCGPANYVQLKQLARQALPVPGSLRGCLPSALWCFIVTSLWGGWKISFGRRCALALVWVCPFFNAGWELVQALGWTDGHADPGDIAAGVVGWGLALGVFSGAGRPVEIPFVCNWRLGLVVTAVACMGFADVWK